MADAPLPALQDITLLSEICDDYLGMCFIVARRRHSQGLLPVKAFRLSGGKRGPLYVHNDDLEALIRRRRTKAVTNQTKEIPRAQPEEAPTAS